MNNQMIAKMIDHAILKPDMTVQEIERSIREAIHFKVRTVCVHSANVGLAASLCLNSETSVCAVVGFPLGQNLTSIKVAEAEACILDGAAEIDMVMNYSWLKSGLLDSVTSEIAQISDICRKKGSILKVIIETDALTVEEVVKAVECVCLAGADYVKTSTGFYTGQKNDGATEEVIQLMKRTAQGRCLVKASGGVRSREKLLKLYESGADRFGVGYGSTQNILANEEALAEEQY